jgi:hypothetical protein
MSLGLLRKNASTQRPEAYSQRARKAEMVTTWPISTLVRWDMPPDTGRSAMG